VASPARPRNCACGEAPIAGVIAWFAERPAPDDALITSAIADATRITAQAAITPRFRSLI
jgi:hypothetical protein